MKEAIVKEIAGFVGTSELNGAKAGEDIYFTEPLVGFASAKDPLFVSLKEIIGDFHMTPREYFEAEFGAGSFTGGTVISWVLPMSGHVLKTSRRRRSVPSRAWAHARYHGENLNHELMQHVVSVLKRSGQRSIAPSLSVLWERVYSPAVGHASNWSERHVAHIAGLGTFGLSDGLITEKGIAHRLGSIVTELALDPTQRPYKGIHDWCLKFSSSTCGFCIKRCPAGAISEKGHDKDACFRYIREEVMPRVNNKYEVTTPSCGLCQAMVPCEHSRPRAKKEDRGSTDETVVNQKDRWSGTKSGSRGKKPWS